MLTLSCVNTIYSIWNLKPYLFTAVSDTSTSTARPVDTITDEECFSRLLDCTLRNPFGFMSDKTCHMCVGKDDIYALCEYTAVVYFL